MPSLSEYSVVIEALENVVQVGQPLEVHVEDRDFSAHADGDLRRGGADDAAADDADAAALHAGHSAEQNAFTAVRLLE